MADWQIAADGEAVAANCADYLVELIRNTLREKEQCHIVLPGGTTPARCLQLLAEKDLPWDKLHWYPGDERCYPVGHSERNDVMIVQQLLSSHPEFIDHLHPMPAELGAESGAATYARQINDIQSFDIVVSGMGEDGHTASLFPDNPALDDPRIVAPVFNAPKPPSERVSLSLGILRAAREKIVIATGSGKADAISQIKNGAPLPVAMLDAQKWFVDEAANSLKS